MTALLISIALAVPDARASACDPIEQMITTTPAPRQDKFAWRTYLEQVKLAAPSQVDLVLVGDSLAQAWDAASWLPMRVVNLGVGGDMTQHVLWRISSAKWARVRTRKVLLILGTNNLSAGNQPCAIAAGLRSVIEKLRSIWPKAEIGFLEIPPRGSDFLFANDARREVNADVRALSGVNSINIDNLITCEWRQPCQYYAADNLHFSTTGYEEILKQVKRRLFD